MNSFPKFRKSFLSLAPIAGVSDSPFRQICKELGAGLVYTELVSAEGLSRVKINKENPFLKIRLQNKTVKLINFKVKERPIALQLFGKNPEAFQKSAAFIQALPKKFQPDIIDLNCGCPAKKVKGHGSGVALMRDPVLVNRILAIMRKETTLPLSIKIRAGIEKEGIWASAFMRQIDLGLISICAVHGRTLEQGFSGTINFAEIKKVKEIIGQKILIANGGIKDLSSAKDALAKTGADGIMIGQAAFGNPWIFEKIKNGLQGKRFSVPTWRERVLVVKKHTRLMIKEKGEERGIQEMRKHFCWYFKGFPKTLRVKLITIKKYGELKEVLKLKAKI